MVSSLVLHKGSVPASYEELLSVRVPDSTKSYCPVPYGELVGKVREIMPRFGMKELGAQFALSPDGQRMFGLLKVETQTPDVERFLALGMRSSYDQSIAPALAGGEGVFICDNLAFSGEIRRTRKQTANVFQDLEELVWKTCRDIERRFQKLLIRSDAMKGIELTRKDVDHILLEAVRNRAIPMREVLPVDLEFRREDPLFDGQFGQNTAWRLFNAFTERYKGRNPWQTMEESCRLNHVFDKEFALSSNGTVN